MTNSISVTIDTQLARGIYRAAIPPLSIERHRYTTAPIDRDHAPITTHLDEFSQDDLLSGLLDRDTEIFHPRTDIVRHTRTDEVLPMARRRDSTAGVVGIGTCADDM